MSPTTTALPPTLPESEKPLSRPPSGSLSLTVRAAIGIVMVPVALVEMLSAPASGASLTGVTVIPNEAAVVSLPSLTLRLRLSAPLASGSPR